MATSGAEALKRIKPTRRKERTQLCLRPDLVHEWQVLDEQLSESTQAVGARLGSGVSETQKELAERVLALEAEIEAASLWFHAEAMEKPEFEALKAQHPPRENDQADWFVGYNRDAVLDQMVRRCIYEPVFKSCSLQECEHTDCGTWDQLERQSSAEWEELRRLVNITNSQVVDPPKSLTASRILDLHNRGSVPPEAGE